MAILAWSGRAECLKTEMKLVYSHVLHMDTKRAQPPQTSPASTKRRVEHTLPIRRQVPPAYMDWLTLIGLRHIGLGKDEESRFSENIRQETSKAASYRYSSR